MIAGRAPVVMILALLTLAPMQAWAECAWVLWTEEEATSKGKAGTSTSVSFDRNVYETRKACEGELVRWMEELVVAGMPD